MTINLFGNKSIPYYPSNVKIYQDHGELPGNSAEELYRASDVIGNYAKAHNAKVSFYDARLIMDEFDNETLSKSLENSVAVSVEKKGAKQAEGTWIKYTNDEKPFLRKVYEVLQGLIENKKSPIYSEMNATKQRLMDIGKIKV